MMGLAKPTDVIISIVILLITGIIIAKIAIKMKSWRQRLCFVAYSNVCVEDD